MRRLAPRLGRSFCGKALVAAAVLFTPTALRAQSSDAERKEQVRQIGTEALALYDKGDCEGAIERFDLAARILRAPTLELYAARCLVKLGHLVEGDARYAAIVSTPIGRDAPETFRTAQETAGRERADLGRRLPRVSIRIDPPSEATDVSADGHAIDKQALADWVFVDPGPHRFEARRGATSARAELSIAEGESRTVVLRLVGDDRSAERSSAPAAADARTSGNAAMRTLGWVGVAAGGIGLGFGIVSGLLALHTKADLSNQGCGDSCPSSRAGEVARYDRERWISSAGFIGGAVLLAGGTLLILITSPKKAASARSVALPALSF